MSFSDLVKRRYSVRKYDSRPIESEKLTAILEAGRLAPTGVNYQPQRILVVQGEDMEKMKGCSPCIFGAPVCMVVCYDKNASWKSRSGRDIGDVDGSIVMTQMMYQLCVCCTKLGALLLRSVPLFGLFLRPHASVCTAIHHWH